MTERLTGKLYKTASGRASYEINDAEAGYVFKVADVLQTRFGFSDIGLPKMGLGEVSLPCRREATGGQEESVLVIGWDNWSGCYVMSVRPEDDGLVAEIGRYLDEHI